jgi:hypothetical protein
VFNINYFLSLAVTESGEAVRNAKDGRRKAEGRMQKELKLDINLQPLAATFKNKAIKQ